MIAWVGVITALFAATIAVAQNDIKKVLAYSTISQLGYMFLAVGSGAYVAAIFHMVTHAFFKALLFLGSGSVIHGMHDEQDMRYMGMLRKWMPVTAATFIIGWLAIAGVPPFAGFWSKDEILLFSLAKSPALYIVGLVTALLTAYYMTRQVVMVFYGEARWQDRAAEHGAHGDVKPHESPWIMLTPLLVLAVLSIVGGIIQLPDVTWLPESITHLLEHWLEPVVEFGEADITGTWGDENKTILMVIATAAAVLGIVIGWLVYEKRRIRANEPTILANAWYYDQAVTDFMGGPGRASWEATAWVDANVVDGAVNGAATTVRETAGELRKGQTGFVRGYAAILGIGAVGLLAWFIVVRGML
jgi:NADH-quinone oxidoreductase subunit L